MMMMMMMMMKEQDPPSGKDSKPAQDKKDDSESDEPPSSKYQGGFCREIHLHHSGDKSGSSKGKSHADLSPGLEEVLHDTEQIHYWKSLAIKQMFGRWNLQMKLAKMTTYVESWFATNKSTTTPTGEKYPHANEGMVHMVLAPTMGCIKSILPEKVGTLLTKAWIRKLAQDATGKPSVKVALSLLEYLVRLQRDYKDMEKRYQLVRKQEFLNMPFFPDT